MRVLVADEGATLREGAAQVLRAAGHEVVCAEDGLQAWQCGSPFDVAFVSSGLPLLDGVALYCLWQQYQAPVGAVVVLVDAEGAQAARCWSALTDGTHTPWTGGAESVMQAYSLLRKPFSLSMLVDLVETMRS